MWRLWSDPVGRCVKELCASAVTYNPADFRALVHAHAPLFRRQHLPQFEQAITSAIPTQQSWFELQQLGEALLDLQIGPLGVFREIAIYAYRTAAATDDASGRLSFE